jgi:hypothetical protein
MKRLPLLFLIGIILLSIPWPVAAMDNTTTISISDLNIVTGSNIEIYGLDANGTWSLLQIANTSSTGIVFQPGVYSVVMKPSEVSRFSDIGSLGSDFLTWSQTHFITLLSFGFMAAVLISIARRR